MSLVYKLQNKLVSSFEGQALAIRKLVANSGAKTPGIDKILWNTPEQTFKAIEELGLITKNPNKYKSYPLEVLEWWYLKLILKNYDHLEYLLW